MEEQKNYTNVNHVKGVRINKNAVRKHTKPNDPNESGINCYSSRSAANLESIHGALLRMNRSIQSEGTFGVLKWDKSYKRLFRRGEKM